MKFLAKELYVDTKKGRYDEKENYRWFQLDEYKKLRKNPDAFHTFVELFVSMVTGKTKHSLNKYHKLLQNYITESDEAFTLLLLENNWEKWIEGAKHK